jgi:hypothetical protein
VKEKVFDKKKEKKKKRVAVCMCAVETMCVGESF